MTERLPWRRSRAARPAAPDDRLATAERTELELELALAEHAARLRVIRELHEVAVHELSVIVSQAEGAQYAAQADPEAAVRSLASIGEAARNTLADLRRVMSLVRDPDSESDDGPRAISYEDLIARVRQAGLVVTVTQTGEPFELRHGAELAVYGILEEALANALEFGGAGTEVAVSFGWTEDSLQLLIDDDGERAIAKREGLDPDEAARRPRNEDEDMSALTGILAGAGITGMRDRAEMFGGVFKAYPVPGVGFSVSAIFPALKYHNGIHGVNLGP